MPEHLRTLLVILALAASVFVFAKAPACAAASAAADFERRRNLWFGVTLVAFLAHHFWIFIVAAAALLLYGASREPNKLALFFFLLFAVPPIPAKISGLGVIEHFFTIDYIRLLGLVILLPAYLHLRRQRESEPFGRSIPDKLLAGYMVLSVLLIFAVSTFTNTLRQGVLYSFLDVFLPYYVASRSLKTLQGFRDVLMAFVVAAMVLSAIGAFEFARHWLLYSPLDEALGVFWGYGGYLEREGGRLRAQASTGQPIPLGYVIAVALAFFLFLRKSVPNPAAWGLGLLLLLAGLIAPVSRGPWLGAAVMFLVFVMTSPSAAKDITMLGLLGVIAVPALLASPLGENIIDHLPFIGNVEQANVTYRQRLLEISFQVILQNPFFGAADYLNSPEMQQLMQGHGIIDVVNTYVGIGLARGLVGLALFAGFFIAVGLGIFKGMRSLADRHDERHLLGRALLATLLGILVIIFTVSSISVIPVIYWSVAGFGVAYARMLALARPHGPGAVQSTNAIRAG